MRAGDQVPRPTKSTEYIIRFDSNSSAKGWRDLYATNRNGLVEAWEFLTKTPRFDTNYSYRLSEGLGLVTRNGVAHERWQLKLNERSGARIWYYVVDREVFIERVFTAHPNQTK